MNKKVKANFPFVFYVLGEPIYPSSGNKLLTVLVIFFQQYTNYQVSHHPWSTKGQFLVTHFYFLVLINYDRPKETELQRTGLIFMKFNAELPR